jgi:hypothetical protein
VTGQHYNTARQAADVAGNGTPAMARIPVLPEAPLVRVLSTDFVEKVRFSVRSQLSRALRRSENFWLERRILSLNQEDFSRCGIHFRKEVIRDAEAVFA